MSAKFFRENAILVMVPTGILLAIAFGSDGIRSFFGAKGPTGYKLPKWNSEISQQEVDSSLRRLNQQYGAYFAKIPEKQLLEIAVKSLLPLKKAQADNIEISPEKIAEKIKSNPYFLNKDGKFDAATYDSKLKEMIPNTNFNTSKRREIFEDSIREQLQVETLENSVIEGVEVEPKAVKEDFHNKFDTLEYNYISFNAEPKEDTKPKEEDIKTYYDTNKSTPDFLSEQKIKLSYIHFNYEKYFNDIKIEDSKVAEYYEKNKEEFKIKPVKKEADKKDPKKKDAIKEEPKYKKLETVKSEIINKLKKPEARKLAKEESAVVIKAISTYQDENKRVDIVKASKQANLKKGIFGETGMVDKKQVDLSLGKLFGNYQGLLNKAFIDIKKEAPSTYTTETGEIIFMVTGTKNPETISYLKGGKKLAEDKLHSLAAWDSAKKLAEKFLEESKKTNFDDTLKLQKLSAKKRKEIIEKASGVDKTIISHLMDKKIEIGDVTLLKRDIIEKEYLVIHYIKRHAASDKKFEKESEAIKEKLTSQLKTEKLSEFRNSLIEASGLKL